MKPLRPIAIALFAALAAAPKGSLAAPPEVVASVAPVHSLVAGVMGGLGVPSLLVRGGRSPHDYALRPSDALLLRRAALVIWVGATLEPHLDRAIAAHARGARVIALMAQPETRLLPARRGDGWDMHGNGHDHAPHSGDPVRADPHIWLLPGNAIAVAKIAARELAALDPAHASRYAANAEHVERRIRALDAELAGQLAPVRAHRYLVFHDAYRYFEDHYRLSPLGAVTAIAGRAPGARGLARLRGWAKEGAARCIFREPQFAPAAVATIREGTGLAEGVLDPLGADIAPGPDHWFALMRGLAGALVSCLSAGN